MKTKKPNHNIKLRGIKVHIPHKCPKFTYNKFSEEWLFNYDYVINDCTIGELMIVAAFALAWYDAKCKFVNCNNPNGSGYDEKKLALYNKLSSRCEGWLELHELLFKEYIKGIK